MPATKFKHRRNKSDAMLWKIILLALILIGIYILYTLSLGQVDMTPGATKDESLAEKKVRAEKEHQRLLLEIETQEALKRKLQKQFRKTYLIVRIIFASLFAAYNFIIYFACEAHTIDELLNWNELLLLAFAAYHFVCYGTLANFNSLVRYFKNRIENRVYRNHKKLEEELTKKKQLAGKIKIEYELV